MSRGPVGEVEEEEEEEVLVNKGVGGLTCALSVRASACWALSCDRTSVASLSQGSWTPGPPAERNSISVSATNFPLRLTHTHDVEPAAIHRKTHGNNSQAPWSERSINSSVSQRHSGNNLSFHSRDKPWTMFKRGKKIWKHIITKTNSLLCNDQTAERKVSQTKTEREKCWET